MLLSTAKIVQFLKLVRYPNLLIMAATQILCAVWLLPLGVDGNLQNIELWLTITATLCIGAGGYIINDIFDMEADAINKPHKVFINQNNKNRLGLIYYGVSVAGIILGLLAHWIVALICLVMVVLLYFYSFKHKKIVFWGNLSVAIMSAAVLLVIVPVLPNIRTDLVLVYAAFAFFTTLMREATKDIEDVEGDRGANYITLPVAKGVAVAQKVVLAETVLLLLGILGFAAWCLIHLKIWAFFYLIILTAIPTVGLLLLVYWAKEKEHYGQASLLSKLIMLSGIISMYFIL